MIEISKDQDFGNFDFLPLKMCVLRVTNYVAVHHEKTMDFPTFLKSGQGLLILEKTFGPSKFGKFVFQMQSKRTGTEPCLLAYRKYGLR